MECPYDFEWPENIIPDPKERTKNSTSSQSIGKDLKKGIDRLNHISSKDKQFPVIITNELAISNQIMTTAGYALASNPVFNSYLGTHTYYEIQRELKKKKKRNEFIKAEYSCIQEIIKHEPLAKASVGYWVAHRAIINKLYNEQRELGKNKKKSPSTNKNNTSSAIEKGGEAGPSIGAVENGTTLSSAESVHRRNSTNKDEVTSRKKNTVDSNEEDQVSGGLSASRRSPIQILETADQTEGMNDCSPSNRVSHTAGLKRASKTGTEATRSKHNSINSIPPAEEGDQGEDDYIVEENESVGDNRSMDGSHSRKGLGEDGGSDDIDAQIRALEKEKLLRMRKSVQRREITPSRSFKPLSTINKRRSSRSQSPSLVDDESSSFASQTPRTSSRRRLENKKYR